MYETSFAGCMDVVVALAEVGGYLIFYTAKRGLLCCIHAAPPAIEEEQMRLNCCEISSFFGQKKTSL